MLTRLEFADQACLSIADRVFLGEGLFETLRVDAARACQAQAHWQRLADSASLLNIPFDLSFSAWEGFLAEGINRFHLQQGGLKLILTAGSAPRGLLAEATQSCLILQAFHYERWTKPLRLVAAPWRRDKANPVYGLKTVNYLEAIQARRWASKVEADEVLFFNSDDRVMEASTANLFLCRGRQLLTPPLSEGLLPGITRARVLSEAVHCGYAVAEAVLTEADLVSADCLFLTNALQGIQWVSSYQGHHYQFDPSDYADLQALIA